MNAASLDIPVAILAGGLGTRLRPLTEEVPKVLLPIAGKPFLAHQLALLRMNGIRRVVLCLGFLGEKVVEEFGTGHGYGVELDYSFDGPTLLGTGGAIRKALPKLGEKFFVLYGDSYLTVSFRQVAEFCDHSGKRGLMTVYRNEGLCDTSNVLFVDSEIRKYDKGGPVAEMRHIDYGLSVFRAEAFEGYSTGQKFDESEVLQRLVAEKQLAGYEVLERFYEMGSPAGMSELESLLKRRVFHSQTVSNGESFDIDSERAK